MRLSGEAKEELKFMAKGLVIGLLVLAAMFIFDLHPERWLDQVANSQVQNKGER